MLKSSPTTPVEERYTMLSTLGLWDLVTRNMMENAMELRQARDLLTEILDEKDAEWPMDEPAVYIVSAGAQLDTSQREGVAIEYDTTPEGEK